MHSLLIALISSWIAVCVAGFGKYDVSIVGVGGRKGSVATAQSNTISYQIHSWNDLNEWPQILKKRATHFKIDPHYADYAFCMSQKRLSPADPRGCFVLNHDGPITTTQYNSTNARAKDNNCALF
jgi:hypothetical protein